MSESYNPIQILNRLFEEMRKIGEDRNRDSLDSFKNYLEALRNSTGDRNRLYGFWYSIQKNNGRAGDENEYYQSFQNLEKFLTGRLDITDLNKYTWENYFPYFIDKELQRENKEREREMDREKEEQIRIKKLQIIHLVDEIIRNKKYDRIEEKGFLGWRRKYIILNIGDITELIRVFNKTILSNDDIKEYIESDNSNDISILEKLRDALDKKNKGEYAGAGSSGTGNTGAGSSGTGNTGAGSSGTGNTGAGSSGTGNTGAGSSGTGNTGAGSSGTGNTGAGKQGIGAGSSGTGNTGAGSSGSRNTGTENSGSRNTGAGSSSPILDLESGDIEDSELSQFIDIMSNRNIIIIINATRNNIRNINVPRNNFRKAMQLAHPDKFDTNGKLKEVMTRIFLMINCFKEGGGHIKDEQSFRFLSREEKIHLNKILNECKHRVNNS